MALDIAAKLNTECGYPSSSTGVRALSTGQGLERSRTLVIEVFASKPCGLGISGSSRASSGRDPDTRISVVYQGNQLRAHSPHDVSADADLAATPRGYKCVAGDLTG